VKDLLDRLVRKTLVIMSLESLYTVLRLHNSDLVSFSELSVVLEILLLRNYNLSVSKETHFRSEYIYIQKTWKN